MLNFLLKTKKIKLSPLVNESSIDILELIVDGNQYELFELACKKGQLDVAIWLASKYGVKPYNLATTFIKTCRHGHLEVAKWLIATYRPKYRWDGTINCSEYDGNSKAFMWGCKKGHLEIVKWLVQKSGIIRPVASYYYNRDDPEFSRQGLLWSCENGHLDVAKWLVQRFTDINVHFEYDRVFRMSCRNGHLEVVIWLSQTFPNINVHSKNEEAFRLSCEKGFIKIARYLVEFYTDINVHERDEYAFRHSCLKGHLGVAKWLLQKFPEIDIHAVEEYAFINSCKYRHLEVAKWLLNTFSNIDIHAKKDEAFVFCCKKGYLEMVEWFKEISKYYIFEIVDGKVVVYYFDYKQETKDNIISEYFKNLGRRILTKYITSTYRDSIIFRPGTHHSHMLNIKFKLKNGYSIKYLYDSLDDKFKDYFGIRCNKDVIKM